MGSSAINIPMSPPFLGLKWLIKLPKNTKKNTFYTQDPILGKPMCFKPAQPVDDCETIATDEVNKTDIMDTVANIISDIQQNKEKDFYN